MPIYDYRCDHCGHAFSAVQSFNDQALEVCPNCGKKPRRLIVAPAVVFKGSGWYKTDSRGAAPKEGDGATPAKKDDTAKDTKKEETKKSDAPAPSSNASTKSEASS
ncbi:MAG TPA: FmdB family zinc ribbon protein [Candidatus Acidoferrales bacterium]|nr:FmdB family zinc ribbon protein [Candidatus Acidoferrales bacterium]